MATIVKKQYFSAFISGTIIYTIIIHRFGISNLLSAVQRIIDDQNDRADTSYFSIKENLIHFNFMCNRSDCILNF